MARGGYRVGAGRPRKDQATEPSVAVVTVFDPDAFPLNQTPLEYMLEVMNDPNADLVRRDRMAIAAAPFMHARADAPGKKEIAAEASRTAGTGTSWGNDLVTPEYRPN